MNQIRLIIFCTSMMLTVWLAASYTAQLDGSGSKRDLEITLHNQTGEALAVGKIQDKEIPPLAHIRHIK